MGSVKTSAFQKFSAYIWDPPHSAETWVRVSLPYKMIDTILKCQKSKKLPTTITTIITMLIGRALNKHPELTRYIRGKKIVQSQDRGVFLTTYFKSNHTDWDVNGIRINDSQDKSIAEVTTEIKEKSSYIKQGKDDQVRRFSWLINSCPHFILSALIPLIRGIVFRMGFNTERVGLPGNRFGSIIITPLHEFGIETAKIPLHRFCNASFVIAICKPYWQLTATGQEKRLPLDITLDHRVIDGKLSAIILNTISNELDQLVNEETEFNKNKF